MLALNAKLAALLGGVAAVVVAGAIWTAHARGDAEGYRRADLEWSVKYTQRENELLKRLFDELERQAYANDVAKEQERAELEIYMRKLLERVEVAEDLARQAAEDPDAGRIALNADAVERYERRIAR